MLFDISFSPPIEVFQAMVEQQRPSKDWTISIFDGEGTSFARVPNPQDTIGKRASPSLYAEMFRNPEGTVPTISLEGVPLITSLARSSLTGWTVAAGDLGRHPHRKGEADHQQKGAHHARYREVAPERRDQ
jgi:hypothetical protein